METHLTVICRKDKVNKQNEAPLAIKISQNYKSKKISLGVKINIDYWNFENNKANSDIQDTEDSKKIKRYQFNLYALGEEI